MNMYFHGKKGNTYLDRCNHIIYIIVYTHIYLKIHMKVSYWTPSDIKTKV